MPLFHRRQRHHSWPYCAASTHGRERPDVTDIRVSNLRSRAREKVPSFQVQKETTLRFDDIFDEDDAVSAGIVRSKSARHHRLWSLSKDKDDEVVSTVTEADELPSAVLRRIIWTQLEKGRLPFMLHTTTSRGDDVTISYLDSLTVPVREKPARGGERGKGNQDDDESLRPLPGRKHRRSHSEQPRAWREPSAGLWTLVEE